MRILYLIPAATSAGPNGPAELVRRQAILQARARSGAEIIVRDVAEAPTTIESIYAEYLAIPGTVKAALKAQRDGFDAVILGCFGDPGLDAIRSVLKIPVIGAAQSALHFAAMLGHSFGILTVADGVIPIISKVIRSTGFESRLAGIRTIGETVAEVREDRDETLCRFVIAGELAVTEDKADTLVLGCMSAGFLDIAPDLNRKLGVPVICPVMTSLTTAESIVACGLQHSKKAYPDPAPYPAIEYRP